MATQTPSYACCNTSPVVAKGYEGKGSYTEYEGMKTYETGPSSASKGILFIYDIFGYFPQSIQGADIIATADSESKYKVFMPDFFMGKPADISWYPPDTDEKGKKLGEFFNTTAAPPKAVENVDKLMKAIQSKHSNIKEWGVIGFCWGGKIVNLTSQQGTYFKAAVAAHPAMIDANDAKAITIPTLMIPSQGESEDDVAAWEKEMKAKYSVEWYKDQLHGFMAARGDLEDAKVKAAYEKAYHSVLSWFHDNL